MFWYKIFSKFRRFTVKWTQDLVQGSCVNLNLCEFFWQVPFGSWILKTNLRCRILVELEELDKVNIWMDLDIDWGRWLYIIHYMILVLIRFPGKTLKRQQRQDSEAPPHPRFQNFLPLIWWFDVHHEWRWWSWLTMMMITTVEDGEQPLKWGWEAASSNNLTNSHLNAPLLTPSSQTSPNIMTICIIIYWWWRWWC